MDQERLGQRLNEAIMLTAPSLDRRLWILDTVTTLAPLLGLFGTILGIFHSFHALASPGHAPMQVTAGVANALVATAAGLVIAMIGLLAFNAFNNQVRLVLHQLDSLRSLILNRTDGAPACLPMSAGVDTDAGTDAGRDGASRDRRAAVA
jgi:outer membrane transport energization protein ExbB (TC 2.C.1.1.1)